jgi:NTP pyrophosphatase (non-canonical NTP hydrolase)
MHDLLKDVLAFRDERDWGQFHSLRHLIVSLNLEAGELLELIQWKSDQEIAALPISPHGRENLSDECADVFMYLLLLTHAAGIDLESATRAKLEKNALKYPKDKAFGRCEKYSSWSKN